MTTATPLDLARLTFDQLHAVGEAHDAAVQRLAALVPASAQAEADALTHTIDTFFGRSLLATEAHVHARLLVGLPGLIYQGAENPTMPLDLADTPA